MPKVDPNYLKNAVLECRQKLKHKGRDEQGRCYVASLEKRIILDVLKKSHTLAVETATNLDAFIEKKRLKKITHKLTRITQHSFKTQHSQLSRSERKKKAKSCSTELLKTYRRTCDYHIKLLDSQQRAIHEILMKYNGSKRPITFSEKREIRHVQKTLCQLNSYTVPLSNRLVQEFILFSKTVKQNRRAMRNHEPLNLQGISKFHEWIQMQARQISETPA
ncbi:MAG: hypothetical protein K2P51_08340 [Rhabdochlamydiaceae bacterium]|nr:hypothetical protein [Rhabdochlamydiaceae bacterium]